MGKFFRGVVAFFIVTALVSGTALPASAEVTLDSLLKRVEALEQENANLRAEIMAIQEKQSAAPVAAAATPSGNFVKSGPEVALYGFVKADLVVSSTHMGNGVITQFNALRPGSGEDSPESQLTAQDTRLGFNFKAPDLEDGGKVTGKIEMDFGSTVTPSNVTYTPRVRLAYIDMAFDKWSINAGQNWDIIAPLNPNILDPGTLWRAGNIGYRHPEVTLTNKFGELFGGNLTTKVGLIDSDDSLQEDAGGVPVSAAFVGYDRDIMGVKSSFGVGGLYGKLDLPGKGSGNGTLYATAVNMTLKFTDWLMLKTEGFAGAGLNKFMGGPSQTNDNTTAVTSKAIPVKGGFVELTYKPIKKLETNIGAGIDDVNEDMTGYTAADKAAVWDKNITYYANLKYSLSKEVLVGLEFQEFDTKWLDGIKAHDQRVETSLIYKF